MSTNSDREDLREKPWWCHYCAWALIWGILWLYLSNHNHAIDKKPKYIHILLLFTKPCSLVCVIFIYPRCGIKFPLSNINHNKDNKKQLFFNCNCLCMHIAVVHHGTWPIFFQLIKFIVRTTFYRIWNYFSNKKKSSWLL